MNARSKRLFSFGIALCAGLVMLVSSGFADIQKVLPVDIKGGLRAGSIHLTIGPPYTGDSTKPFDGNQFTEMAILGSDTLSLTVRFDTLVPIQKNKVFFWNNGKWLLDGANTLADLETKSGTYALLVDSNSCSFFTWDSSSFAERSLQYVRLRARNTSAVGVYLGEWTLEGTVTFTKFLVLPYPTRVIPGARLQLSVKLVDDRERVYPNLLTEPVVWSTGDPSIAQVDYDGKLLGVAVGTTTVTASTELKTLTGSNEVSVVADFKPQKVAPMTVKVALVLQDPRYGPTDQRIHEMFHWYDPRVLSNDLVRHFREATDSVVNFEFVEIIDADTLFTRFYGGFLSVADFVKYLNQPGWDSLKAASASGDLYFDYRECVKYYHFDDKRNNGEIDEVWVFAAPYLGMYESQLMGPNAFWWNSPPIKTGTALTKLLSVMGLNYERGVDQAFHSFGHRFESAMRKAYQDVTGRDWCSTCPNPTPWDLYTRIDKDMPGQAHVGNVHFPPNGTSDYNYNNTRVVTSYAENWYRYPYLFDLSSQVNVSTWYYTPGDPLAEGLDHLGYMRWWYGHMPRYVGIKDGVLNNWWHYFLDYEAAVALAKVTPVGVRERNKDPLPQGFRLEQNYPNPFNPTTVVRYQLPVVSDVKLVLFDILGREVSTLVNEVKPAGSYAVRFDGSALAGGVYFYRLRTPAGNETKKMLLVR